MVFALNLLRISRNKVKNTRMNMALLSAALMLQTAEPQTAPDQTDDALLVLKFVDAIKRGATEEAQSMLVPGANISGSVQRKATSFAEFADYARGCGFRRVYAISGASKGMPVSVDWYCGSVVSGRLESDRHASFWIEGKRIRRIGWGAMPVIRISPVSDMPTAG